MTVASIDLTATDLFAEDDPHKVWKWLRHNDPVHHQDAADGGFWALTKYQDIVDVYLHPERFSSAYGTMLGGSYRNQKDTASGRMMIVTDPPRHRHLRNNVHQAGFGNRMIERVRERVAETMNIALDRFVERGSGDFAREVALALPTGVLAGLMDLPAEDAATLLRSTRNMIGFQDDEYRHEKGGTATLVESQMEIFEFFSEVVDQRRSAPGEDMVSMLLGAELNGEPMTETEILYNCLNVAVGGNETTPHTASYSVLTFIEQAEQHERLLADPSLLPTAVDELFRWTSTNTYVQRTTTCPVTIRDQEIGAGESITLWNSSANRDEDVFDEPDRFDVGRSPNKHIAFGVGHHRCIGATVAKLEIEMFVEALVNRGLRFRLTGPVEKLHSNFMLGIRHLPVEIVA